MPKNRTLIAVLCLLPLLGCSGNVAPTFELISARTLERSDEGEVVALTFRGENPNDYEIDLRRARYTVSSDGRELFSGRRSAEVGLPRLGRVDMTLLAAWPIDLAPPDGSEITVTGSVEYLTPGPLVETLYDNRIRRPSASLSGTVPIER